MSNESEIAEVVARIRPMLERLGASANDHRTLVIVAMSMIEDALKSLLEAFCIPDSASWIAKTSVFEVRRYSFSLGLINANESKQIKAMADARNAFAHNWRIDSLNDNDLKSATGAIRTAALQLDATAGDLFKPATAPIGAMYAYLATALIHDLLLRGIAAKRARVQLQADWPKSSRDLRNGFMFATMSGARPPQQPADAAQ